MTTALAAIAALLFLLLVALGTYAALAPSASVLGALR